MNVCPRWSITRSGPTESSEVLRRVTTKTLESNYVIYCSVVRVIRCLVILII